MLIFCAGIVLALYFVVYTELIRNSVDIENSPKTKTKTEIGFLRFLKMEVFDFFSLRIDRMLHKRRFIIPPLDPECKSDDLIKFFLKLLS